MNDNYLIMIPTYNEKDNVENMFSSIKKLGLGSANFLFIDDNSPDGTGAILDSLVVKHHELKVLHRTGKLGIGSAHYEGIRYAYHHGYSYLITLDCDFTHPPEYIFKLIRAVENYDVVVTTRYSTRDGVKDWNLFRKTLTWAGHFLTKYLLQMEYDATGAFRIYNLKTIDQKVFDLVESKGYSFFFESLFIIHLNHYRINEIPIVLSKRTYGSSKMRFSDALNSLKLLMKIFLVKWIHPERYFVK